MIIYGGEDRRNQILEVQNCGLERIGLLPFEFRSGTCTTGKFLEVSRSRPTESFIQ